MLEITALTVITLIYVIPLNLFFYSLAEKIAMDILLLSPLLQNTDKVRLGLMTSLLYILFLLTIFLLILLFFKFILFRLLYVYFNIEIDVGKLLAKYCCGQRNINNVARGAILLMLIFHLVQGIMDIRIIVFGLLSIIFIYK